MKAKPEESKLLDVEIDGERALERLRKLGRSILSAPKSKIDKVRGREKAKRERSRAR